MPAITIHLIQPTDAPQHSGKLQEIFEELKTENRITNYRVYASADDLTSLAGAVTAEDMVITILTHGMEAHKGNIEAAMSKLKEAGVTVAEVIIDNVTYEKEFITFPSDLKPIQSREDTDAAWEAISVQLREMFPEQKKEPIPWIKYLKYAGIAIVVAIIIWGGLRWFGKPSSKVDFTYQIRDFVTLKEVSDSVYYIPNSIQFSGIFNQPDSVKWNFSDSTFADELNPIKNFINTGDYKVQFNAFKRGKRYSKMKIISAFSPPIADFSAPEDGCVANPQCTINFLNNSTGADSYSWEFGDGTSSEETQPQKSYTPGEYFISLTATNSFGKSDVYYDTITILERPVPFAKFKAVPNHPSNPRQVTFQNQSQNANRFIWDLGDGNIRQTTSPTGTFVHTYGTENTYLVRLLAKQGDTDEDDIEETVYAKRRRFNFTHSQNLNYQQLNQNQREDVRKFILQGSQFRPPTN